jgi:protein-S-isoprenylcysteine O-methyltransferase Ste14
MKSIPLKDILYVSFQLVLFVLFCLPGPQSTVPSAGVLKYSSMVVVSAGFSILLLAIVQLSKNLTPFPSPKADSTLIQEGLYRYVRHPIYSGILLIASGMSLYDLSIWRGGVTLMLGILFYFKSRYEEILLQRRFEAYKEYQMKTGRFFPML